ncbi:MAG: hypothetical protein CO120_02605, partial [Gammaproteobacteria bacterium CG_4_9_14_3_um_filter_38_9]
MSRLNSDLASVELTDQGDALSLTGNWSIDHVGKVDLWIQQLSAKQSQIKFIQANGIKEMDTAGALLLHAVQKKLSEKNNIEIKGLQSNFQSLLQLVTDELSVPSVFSAPSRSDFFSFVGKKTIDLYRQAVDMLAFLGEV